MRLSTLYMYKNSAETMTKRMSQSNDVYLRMSAGKTLLKASDDPAAATDAVKHRTRWRSWRCIATCVPAPAARTGQYSQRRGEFINHHPEGKIVAAKTGSYSPEDRRALGRRSKASAPI